MESVSQTLPLLRELAQGIAAQFGERCEVVVHDWSQPYETRSCISSTAT